MDRRKIAKNKIWIKGTNRRASPAPVLCLSRSLSPAPKGRGIKHFVSSSARTLRKQSFLNVSRSTSLIKNVDTKIRPQDDFFHFACGTWIKNNPIPPTKSKWGTFYILREQGLKKLKTIIEDLAFRKKPKKGSGAQLVRDFYRSGIDVKTRNKLGIKPIEMLLKQIDDISSREDLIYFITQRHRNGLSTLWGEHVWQDDKNSARYNVFIVQSGLSLPDRDFYLKKDIQSARIRKAFQTYIEESLIFTRETPAEARKKAKAILSFETRLARISMSKEDVRDIEKTYHKKRISELQKLAPNVKWRTFLDNIGLRDAREVVVMQPKFLRKATNMIFEVPLHTWKTYLTWSIIDEISPFLSSDFMKIRFNFYGKVLMGQQKMEPEWKRVISAIEHGVGEALGKEYVKRHFPRRAQKKVSEMVDHIFTAYRKRMQKLDWMSPKTKERALEKLAGMSRKLGYPERWRSYRGLLIKPDTYVENVFRSVRFERRRELKRLGKKVDRKEWFATPQTVNAFYSPNMNEIVFPAGILQPPFFDPYADDAINYGAIGSVIGHEITHGFDDQGAKFDYKGNLNNWWTRKDKKRFERKTKPLVSQFNKYRIGKVKMNGKLTLGENIADLGGFVIAYDAYQKHLIRHTGRKIIKGFTPEQRFFLGVALVECAHERPESVRTSAIIDTHSRPIFRINGPVSNMPEFYKAYKVSQKDKLYRTPPEQIKIW